MLQIEHDPRTHCYQRQTAGWWRRSLLTSTVGHFLLVLFLATDLAAILFILLGLSNPPPGVQEPIVLEVRAEEMPEDEGLPEVFVAVEPFDKQEAFAAAKAVAGTMDFEDPALQQPLDYDFQPSEAADSPVVDIEQFVKQNLTAAVTRANQQTVEENLEQLDELAQRIESSSSAESIDSVTNVIGNLLGTKERATRPADEPVAGAFDFNSGQISDIIRKEQDPEGYLYMVLLVDAEGRQVEVELTGPEAKQAFEAFEKIKRYPFLDKIYRSVVMSLLDGVIQR